MPIYSSLGVALKCLAIILYLLNVKNANTFTYVLIRPLATQHTEPNRQTSASQLSTNVGDNEYTTTVDENDAADVVVVI